MSSSMVYLDKATFDAELDRLTGVYLKLRVAAQKQGIEIEMAVQQAFEGGQLAAEDHEMLRLLLLGGLRDGASPNG
ncbi:hypothetical protein JMJ56_29305 [Belnapia sp. T18]|uniref:Uncharacterized protein n=1 Tax=Belnapia arida TaxID=2804533 RepID=A0ABS1UBL6_9PROT|nr:hypothetical protein [Belnapia arida]MBL6082078.1 hypothetical protein [Belnapia arida]